MFFGSAMSCLCARLSSLFFPSSLLVLLDSAAVLTAMVHVLLCVSLFVAIRVPGVGGGLFDHGAVLGVARCNDVDVNGLVDDLVQVQYRSVFCRLRDAVLRAAASSRTIFRSSFSMT